MTKRFGVEESGFEAHEQASRDCCDNLSQYFDLLYEVQLQSSSFEKKKLRIDLLAIAKEDPRYIIGIEVKPGFYRMSDYAKAIKQAADYRGAVVKDERIPELTGKVLAATLVFPRWNGGHDEIGEYSKEARGMEILAHHFRVGFVSREIDGVHLIMNEKRLWRDGSWTGLAAQVLGSKDSLGSMKFTDIRNQPKL